MGMTVGCAQCHDHRYDPIPQKDYYQIRAIFEPGSTPRAGACLNSRRITLYTDADRNKAAEIEAEAKKADAERQKKIEFFIERTLTWKLEAVPEKDRAELREAYRSKKRTDPQNAILKNTRACGRSAPVRCIYTTANTTAKSASSTPSGKSLPIKKTTKRRPPN